MCSKNRRLRHVAGEAEASKESGAGIGCRGVIVIAGRRSARSDGRYDRRYTHVLGSGESRANAPRGGNHRRHPVDIPYLRQGEYASAACANRRSGACGACGSGLYSNPPANNGPVSGVSPPARKPTHPYVQTLKRPQVPKDQEQNASRAAEPKAGALTTNQNATRQAQPEVDGLVINQSAGQQAQPQVPSPVTNSAN